MINFDIYSRTITYKLSLCNIGSFRDSVYFCKSYSNNTRGSYWKYLRSIIILCICKKLMLSSAYNKTLLACSLLLHKELVHRLYTIPVCTCNLYRSSITLCITAPDSVSYLYILYSFYSIIGKSYLSVWV